MRVALPRPTTIAGEGLWGPHSPPPSHISKTLLRLPSTQAHLGRLGSVPRAAVAQPLVDPPDLSLLYPNRPPTSIGFWQASESGPHSGLGKEEVGRWTHVDGRRALTRSSSRRTLGSGWRGSQSSWGCRGRSSPTAPRRRERPRDGMAYGDDPDWRRSVAHHAFGVVGPRRHGSDASGEHQARRGWGVDGVTRARLRRGIRKRREAREARERKARRVWAASLPPPLLETSEGPEPCRHSWGEPEAVSFSCGSRDEIRVCAKCQGFVHRCKRCRGYHMVYEGRGGEYSMPSWVSESWLKEHGCADEAFGDVPVPSVRTPIDHEPPMFDLATYGEIDGEPGRYQLEWFS